MTEFLVALSLILYIADFECLVHRYDVMQNNLNLNDALLSILQ